MNKKTGKPALLVLVFLLVFVGNIPYSQAQTNPREGWAVLLEMNEYPSGYSNLDTGHADTAKWNNTLTALGWEQDHIQITVGTLSFSVLLDAMDFLSDNADDNDVVLFYVFAHGTWMDGQEFGNSDYLTSWRDIQSQHKLMVLSTCHSGDFLIDFEDETAPHIHISSTDQGELGLAGEANEDVAGCLFNHFFTAAFLDDDADQDDNQDISVEEAFAQGYSACREYIDDEVFPEDPDLAALFSDEPQHPQMDDSYAGQFSLQVEEHLEQGVDPLVIVGVVGAVIIISVVVIVIRTQR